MILSVLPLLVLALIVCMAVLPAAPSAADPLAENQPKISLTPKGRAELPAVGTPMIVEIRSAIKFRMLGIDFGWARFNKDYPLAVPFEPSFTSWTPVNLVNVRGVSMTITIRRP